jgi:hypothetical protein
MGSPKRILSNKSLKEIVLMILNLWAGFRGLPVNLPRNA